MGKKRGRTARKRKQEKRNRPSRLESKLRRYWQEGRWDAFVTCCSRRDGEQLNEETRHLWDKAVFNLLIQTLFVDRSLEMLPSLYATLEAAPPVSAEVRKCLDLAKLAQQGLAGSLQREMVEALGPGLPEPFAALRTGLLTALEASEKRVQEHVRLGFPKRATDPGIKALKAFAQSFENLRRSRFRPKSITPYTTWLKHSEALTQRLAETGMDQDLAGEMHDLVMLCRDLFAMHRKGRTVDEDDLKAMAPEAAGFEHPALHDLWQTAYFLLGHLFSVQKRDQVFGALQAATPSLLPEAVRSAPRFQAWRQAVKEHNVRKPGEPRLLALCRCLLAQEEWSLRERFLLSALVMNSLICHFQSQGLFETIFRPEPAPWFRAPDVIREMLKAHAQVHPQGAPPRLPFTLWNELLTSAPRQFIRDQMTLFEQEPDPLPFPDATILHMAMTDSRAGPEKKLAALEKIVGRPLKGGLSLTGHDCDALMQDVDMDEDFLDALQAWERLLKRESWIRVLDECAQRLVQKAMQGARSPISFLFDIQGPLEMDMELVSFLADKLARDSPLRGFMEMVEQVGLAGQLPRTKKEAEPYLRSFPPEDTAVKLLFWMLSWSSRQAPCKTFLMECITRLKDALTAKNKWLALVRKMDENFLTILYPQLMAAWEQAGWIAAPVSDDFRSALEHVRQRIRPAAKKKRNPAKSARRRSMF